jgi:hypothetical protein
MHDELTHLSLARRELVALMSRLQHGTIERFRLANGEPILDPAPRLVYELQIGRTNGSGAPRTSSAFSLKAPVVELLDLFTRVRDAQVAWLEVRHGLPTRISLDALPDGATSPEEARS